MYSLAVPDILLTIIATASITIAVVVILAARNLESINNHISQNLKIGLEEFKSVHTELRDIRGRLN